MSSRGVKKGEAVNNQRRHKRIEINVLEVSGTVMFTSEVKIIDISIEGIALETTKRLNMNNSYALRLKDKSRAISHKGTVVWSSISGTRKGSDGDVIPIYKAGLKFTEMPPEKAAELHNFIEIHKKDKAEPEKGKRLSVRFHINNSANATVNLPESYKVKKISLGGMLIKSVHAFEIESRIPMELSLQDDNPITFTGRVASCLKTDSDDEKRYDIGIEFLDLTDEDRTNLKVFVEYVENIECRHEKGSTAGEP